MTGAQHAELRDRVAEARAENLAKADEVRSYRSDLKEDLKAGAVTLRDVLAATDAVRGDLLQTMNVRAIVAALPGIARVKARELCSRAGIGADTTLEALTGRQAARLLELVEPCPTCGRMRR